MLTTKQNRIRKLNRRLVRAIRSGGTVQEGTCQVCGQGINRNVFAGEVPSPWWHDMAGQDLKHKPKPIAWWDRAGLRALKHIRAIWGADNGVYKA